MSHTLELGVDTFGDVTVAADGRLLTQAETLRNVVEEGILADQIGLDFFGVGEHHRRDFSIAAPEVVLGAIAARTSPIHLGSAVTVLSTDDPVRVFQRFSTPQRDFERPRRSHCRPRFVYRIVSTLRLVAAKIAATCKALGLARFDLKYSNGTLPHEAIMRSIELSGTKVVPMVRDHRSDG